MAKKKQIATKSSPEEATNRKLRPAMTIEGRENQMIALAVDLAEQQLRDGTASAQVITHYLKLGSTKERLEMEKLKRENELLTTKKEAIETSQHAEELYENALNAFKSYIGDTSSYDE